MHTPWKKSVTFATSNSTLSSAWSIKLKQLRSTGTCEEKEWKSGVTESEREREMWKVKEIRRFRPGNYSICTHLLYSSLMWKWKTRHWRALWFDRAKLSMWLRRKIVHNLEFRMSIFYSAGGEIVSFPPFLSFGSVTFLHSFPLCLLSICNRLNTIYQIAAW